MKSSSSSFEIFIGRIYNASWACLDLRSSLSYTSFNDLKSFLTIIYSSLSVLITSLREEITLSYSCGSYCILTKGLELNFSKLLLWTSYTEVRTVSSLVLCAIISLSLFQIISADLRFIWDPYWSLVDGLIWVVGPLIIKPWLHLMPMFISIFLYFINGMCVRTIHSIFICHWAVWEFQELKA